MAFNPITTGLLAFECILTYIIIIVYYSTNTFYGSAEANDYGEGVMFMSAIVSVLLLASLSAESKTRFNGLYAVIGGLMYFIAGIVILAQWSGTTIFGGSVKNGGLSVGSLSLFQGAGMIVRGVFHFKESV